MSFITSEENGIIIVTINLVDATSGQADNFKDFMLDLIENKKTPKIIIDLGIVEYIDSQFIGTLILALRIGTKYNTDIKLTNLQPEVRSTFELTRLYTVFKIFPTTDDAILSFS